MNLIYSRSGGGDPTNDERLAIAADGAFALRRVVGANAAGMFAGQLPEEGIAELEALAEKAKAVSIPEPATQMPNQVRESMRLGEREWDFLLESELPGGLDELAVFARALTEELTDEPTAALALTISDDATSAAITAVGDAPVTADFSAAAATYSLFGEEQEYLSSGTLALELPASRGEVEPGWIAEFALPEDLDFTPQKTLQLRFTCRLKYDDGIWRVAQITAVAGKGWF